MKWEKRGRIYNPSGALWWARSYAIFPTVEVVGDQFIRVYFASLDENRFGRVGYLDLDPDEPGKILYMTNEPVLDIGELGTFDDSGINPFTLVTVGAKKYLYYQGWQRCERVPYMLFTGLAIGDQNNKFEKWARIPVLDRTEAEPFIRAAPYVLIEDGVFKMWYVSGTRWLRGEAGLHYNVVIRYATSTDGISWKANDHICIEPNTPDEYGVGRPCVVREGNLYRMWYSIRSFSQLYIIGYAESADGIHWERKDDEAGIGKSESGWDSEMVCYPCVVDARGKRYMFYNGNRHGSTGFGYAVLET